MLIHEAKSIFNVSGKNRLKDCAKYAVLLSFKRKIEDAKHHIAYFLEKTSKPVISCGGGKDSTAIAILARSLDPTIPLVCGDPPNPLSDRETHLKNLFSWLGGSIHRVPYAWDVKDVLEGTKKYPEGLKQRILAKWHREHDVDGVIFGIRVSESRSRRLNFAHNGYVYKTNAGWRCQPIANLSAEEVICVAMMYDAPINPIYERQKGNLDFNFIRDGTWWPHGYINISGWIKEYYPEHYEEHCLATTIYDASKSTVCLF